MRNRKVKSFLWILLSFLSNGCGHEDPRIPLSGKEFGSDAQLCSAPGSSTAPKERINKMSCNN